MRKRVQNLKTYFLNSYNNFTLEIETSLAKRVVKFISETRNGNVIVYVWFIYSFSDKKIKKTWNVEKNNS